MKLKTKDIPQYGDYDKGERLELPRGMYAVVKIHQDEDAQSPEQMADGHGVVTSWETRDKLPSERVLHTDGRSKIFYDIAASIERAKAEGWDAPPYKTGTKGERAARAVEADFQFLRGWYSGAWSYIGVEVSLYDKDDARLNSDSLWGLESLGDYWREHVAEQINFMYAAELKERLERAHWAARDVATNKVQS